jgi:hypothetical protein
MTRQINHIENDMFAKYGLILRVTWAGNKNKKSPDPPVAYLFIKYFMREPSSDGCFKKKNQR